MSCKLTIEQICTMTESPLFDRKSARIDAKTLAIHLIALKIISIQEISELPFSDNPDILGIELAR